VLIAQVTHGADDAPEHGDIHRLERSTVAVSDEAATQDHVEPGGSGGAHASSIFI
jgi:hypothetical protein